MGDKLAAAVFALTCGILSFIVATALIIGVIKYVNAVFAG